MSRKRRTFTPEQKTKIVLEAIRGEKEINELASEYKLQPNLIRNWKREFLENASTVFDTKRDEKAMEAANELQEENDELAKKVGRLSIEVDWLKKNLKKLSDLTTRVSLVKNIKNSKTSKIPVKRAAELLDVNRTSIYYKGRLASAKELEIMDHMDRMHTDNPAWGSRQLTSQLKGLGYEIGRYKVRRFMNDMGIEAIYPKPNLSKPMAGHKIYPYLLKNRKATGPNQFWSIDITYIRLSHGFVYLTAIIDWYSRSIVAWGIDDTLDTTAVLNVAWEAFEIGKPDILNSDQGSQFTSSKYTEYLKGHDVKISMDGKSRWADNIMIERWFRTLKYEEVYLNVYANIRDARKKIGNFVNTYNWARNHSAIGYKTPTSLYYNIWKQAA